MLESIKKLRRYPIVLAFFGFLFLYTAMDLCVRDRLSDEYENRKLAQFPTFSWQSLAKNEWTAAYEDYVQDQFLWRHEWTVVKSVAERLLLKCENNGVVYGRDGYQFAKFTALPVAPDGTQSQLACNTAYLARFAQRHPGLVTVMVVPSASNILADKLPAGVPLLPEDALLDETFAALQGAARVADVREALSAAAPDNQLFYRTDHHWTTYGAFVAYQAAAAGLGAGRFDPAAHTAVEVPDFLGTNYNKSLRFDSRADTLVYYDLPCRLTVRQLATDGSELYREEGGLYDLAKLEGRDKYAMFLRGNNGYSTIEGQGDPQRRILVIKDSYANCFVPFLTADFGQVDVVDLRYWKYNVETLLEMYDYDEVLVLYNFQTFASETTLFYLNAMVTD